MAQAKSADLKIYFREAQIKCTKMQTKDKFSTKHEEVGQ